MPSESIVLVSRNPTRFLSHGSWQTDAATTTSKPKLIVCIVIVNFTVIYELVTIAAPKQLKKKMHKSLPRFSGSVFRYPSDFDMDERIRTMAS